MEYPRAEAVNRKEMKEPEYPGSKIFSKPGARRRYGYI